MRRDDRVALGLLAIVLVALAAAGIAPYDRRVFALEVVPWVLLLGILVAIHPRFPLTPLSQVAIAVLCLFLVVGAHYTYTRVPFGIHLRDALDLARIVSLICLAGGALYEILEWWIALLAKQGAARFLAMQGDQWDTQWDMFLALLGGMLAQLLFGRLQDRQMRRRGLTRSV